MKTESYYNAKLINHNPFRVIILLIAVAMALNITAMGAPRQTNEDRLVIKVTNDPQFPLGLKNRGIFEGSVRVLLVVNSNDVLEDWIVVEATHKDFAKEVDQVIGDWHFIAPKENGIAMGTTQFINIEFTVEGFMLMTSDVSTTLSLMYNLPEFMDSEQVRVVSARELDQTPVPVYVEEPVIPSVLLSEDGPRSAIFEFYIDVKGAVHVPLLRGDIEMDERALRIVQNSLMKWQFDPVTLNGRPVIVKAAQPFKFTMGKEQPVDDSADFE